MVATGLGLSLANEEVPLRLDRWPKAHRSFPLVGLGLAFLLWSLPSWTCSELCLGLLLHPQINEIRSLSPVLLAPHGRLEENSSLPPRARETLVTHLGPLRFYNPTN
jgi:hypothetical protein